MTMGAKAVFVDTNVLVYANVISAPLHNTALNTIKNHYHTGATLWINRQVIREYLATLTRRQQFSFPISIGALESDIKYFQSRFRVAGDDQTTTDKLIDLLGQIATGGKQV